LVFRRKEGVEVVMRVVSRDIKEKAMGAGFISFIFLKRLFFPQRVTATSFLAPSPSDWKTPYKPLKSCPSQLPKNNSPPSIVPFQTVSNSISSPISNQIR